MNRIFLHTVVLLLFSACALQDETEVLDPSNKVWVVAHRGDWRNAPENSIPAIKRCIDLGVDMVEIDIRMTKDGHLVVIHDQTIERTTNGKGKVSQMFLREIKSYNLLNGYGLTTDHSVPTLKEALLVCKDKIAVFIDKGYPFIKEVYGLADSLGMVDQLYFEGRANLPAMAKKYPSLMHKINYMPRVYDDTKDLSHFVTDFDAQLNPRLYITSFSTESSQIISKISLFKESGARVMAAPLWSKGVAGHTDDVSVIDPDEGWGWLIGKGFNAICTDRPTELLAYLREKGLHK